MLRPSTTLTFLVAIMLLAMSVRPTAAQTEQRCFQETGFCISGRFRQYWEQNGGLSVFGYPVTEARAEKNRDTGATYQTQYFERTRFELHPENKAPYDVLLGRLGVDLIVRMGAEALTKPQTNPDYSDYTKPTTPFYFPETGFAIDPGFVAYWTTHGLDLGDPIISQRESLALFGAPVSRAFTQVNPDGDEVWMQWFERARFEGHREQGVLLGRITANLMAYNQPSTNGYIALGDGTIINPQNGARRGIPCNDAIWSPDGQRLACQYDVKIMGYDGSNIASLNMRVDSVHSVRWSPNGSQIAFVSGNTNEPGNLFVVNADGSGPRQLTNTPNITQNPQWSPDGKRIVFNAFSGSVSHIFAINPDGSNFQQLTADDGIDASWSSDGTRIVFTSKRTGNMDVYVMNADGSNQTALANDWLDEKNAQWSPDGTYISFEKTQANGTGPNPRHDMYIMNADGNNQRALGNTSEDEYGAQWSPDGTRILYHRFYGGYNTSGVVVDADGSGETLVGGGVDSAWSPDSKQIVYITDGRVSTFTWIVNADGSNRRLILRGGMPNVEWAPR